jgi:hypothetical protein
MADSTVVSFIIAALRELEGIERKLASLPPDANRERRDLLSNREELKAVVKRNLV